MFARSSICKKLIKLATIPQYSRVPTTAKQYLKQTKIKKIIWRIVKKRALLIVFFQSRLEIKNIPPGSKILFLYTGKRNFGDAILELSGRALLKNKNFSIDLLALPNIATLFEDDKIFKKVYTDPKIARQNQYDYLLLSEFNQRSISLKIRFFRSYKFACMFRFFYGPDRNQILFSYFAFNEIFKLQFSDKFIKKKSKLTLQISRTENESAINLLPKHPYIVIAVGGIDDNRTYNNWVAVLKMIDQNNLNGFPDQVVLVGSDNGLISSNEILNTNFERIKIKSLVDQTNIKQCQAIINNAEIFLGADGGLMHVAHTTKTDTVVLFGKEPHRLRVTNRTNSIAIQANLDVNEVPPSSIFNALAKQTKM